MGLLIWASLKMSQELIYWVTLGGNSNFSIQFMVSFRSATESKVLVLAFGLLTGLDILGVY